MPTSTITLDGNTVTLVPWVTSPAPNMVEPWVNDSVASIMFPFTGKTQTQGSSAADLEGWMCTYAPLDRAQAAPIKAWLMQMRGISRATQLAPPDYQGPQGAPSGTPEVHGAQLAGATTLATKGWTANGLDLLLPADIVQIGYRLHWVLDAVSADASGDASFEIFPTLYEDLADGAAIITANPMGLYRLAQNKRNWSTGVDGFTHVSFPLVAYK